EGAWCPATATAISRSEGRPPERDRVRSGTLHCARRLSGGGTTSSAYLGSPSWTWRHRWRFPEPPGEGRRAGGGVIQAAGRAPGSIPDRRPVGTRVATAVEAIGSH